MLKVDFDMGGIDAQLSALEAKVAAAIRPAAAAAAEVLYYEVRLNAPRSEKAHFGKGHKFTYQPGNLQNAVYQAFAESDSEEGKRATYSISWNKKKAFYGRFVEFGTAKMPAHSFLRKAYAARISDALAAGAAEFADKVGTL